MLDLDDCQYRYMEDLETKDWLKSVLNTLGEKRFPGLKENLDNLPKADLDRILDEILEDAEQYEFIDDDELLVRYGIWSVNHQQTPMNTPVLAAAIRKSETVVLGIMDQIALADWTVRARELFGVQIK